jgi:glycosyltransferase involved in cell wall biosynthesis
MNKPPMVSVVLPSFQQAAFLEEAVRSVLDQKSSEVELLVMDPGSTDGSRPLLMALQKEYGERLVLHFEPDKGQSDAINRGFVKARGKILSWLNSDDRLRPGALEKVVPWLDSPQPRWLYGCAGMIDERGRPHASLIVRYKNWRGRNFSRYKLLTENFIPQMSVFWNLAMWDAAGGLDLEKHLDMDYDLWLRFAQVADPLVINDVLADFRVHGGAKGSLQSGPQLDAAFVTAWQHSTELGWQGKLLMVVHRFLSLRTRLLYWLIKP